MNRFGKSYTREQFKDIKKFNTLYFNYMVEKGTKNPVYYKNEDGTPTDVQKIAISDEAGNLQAIASQKVARDIANGVAPKTKGVTVFTERIYDSVDESTGEAVERVSYTLNYKGQSNSELMEDIL